MKTSGYLVLYISENDDFELWRALCQYTPEERAAIVQAALRKGLLTDGNPGIIQAAAAAEPQRAQEPQRTIEPQRSPEPQRGFEPPWARELQRTQEPRRAFEPLADIVPTITEPLRTPEPKRFSNQASGPLSRSPIESSGSSRPSLQPPVAANPAQQQNAASPSPIADLMLDDLGADLIRSLTNDEFTNPELTDLNDLSTFLQPAETQPTTSLPGLDFLLNNVIGEEDDESVVEYIRRTRADIGRDQG